MVAFSWSITCPETVPVDADCAWIRLAEPAKIASVKAHVVRRPAFDRDMYPLQNICEPTNLARSNKAGPFTLGRDCMAQYPRCQGLTLFCRRKMIMSYLRKVEMSY